MFIVHACVWVKMGVAENGALVKLNHSHQMCFSNQSNKKESFLTGS